MIIIVILAVAAGVMVAEGGLQPWLQTLEAERPEWGEKEEKKQKKERWTCGSMCFGKTDLWTLRPLLVEE